MSSAVTTASSEPDALLQREALEGPAAKLWWSALCRCGTDMFWPMVVSPRYTSGHLWTWTCYRYKHDSRMFSPLKLPCVYCVHCDISHVPFSSYSGGRLCSLDYMPFAFFTKAEYIFSALETVCWHLFQTQELYCHYSSVLTVIWGLCGLYVISVQLHFLWLVVVPHLN